MSLPTVWIGRNPGNERTDLFPARDPGHYSSYFNHLLSEIDQMASHVGIINQGSLIFQDSLSVLHEHSRSKMLLHTSDDQTALQYLKHSGISCHWQDGRIMLNTLEDNRIMQAVSLLVNSGIGILRLEEQQMSLEEIFLHLTGKQVSL